MGDFQTLLIKMVIIGELKLINSYSFQLNASVFNYSNFNTLKFCFNFSFDYLEIAIATVQDFD